ncbi:MAG TPA: pseudouridine synthase [Spirochaetota bacterium]|nr:pseudouridine synthase [Spirochaetota bacterium]HOM38975.1 pseudouridine synthase [Spirochaetota bacterium]HPQ48365.1 pseudouridine synthase [Spirochaetota bacterium]
MKQNRGIRINRYLAICGLGSRRKCEKLIEEGQIKINNKIALLSDTVSKEDKVFFNNNLLKPEEKSYYILYKPPFVVSTLNDPQGRKTIKDFIKNIDKRVYPVGRLDFESEGIIILTNDGDLSHRLLHPKYDIEKEYIVYVDKFLTEEEEKIFERGVKLEEGITRECKLYKEKNFYRVIIRQGWYRQIRRMFAYFGANVTFLKRIRIANINIGSLKKGEIRRIEINELKELRKIVFKS